jgi:hypothetical protein
MSRVKTSNNKKRETKGQRGGQGVEVERLSGTNKSTPSKKIK